MDGIYVYTDIDINKLYPGVNRPQSWIDEHPSFSEMIDKLIKSFKKDGVRYPLCAVNLKDDGTYEVTTGNQRLLALRKVGSKTAPCIIACKHRQKHVPKGRVLNNKKEILDYFGGSVKQICMDKGTFFVIAKDNIEWDPHKVFKEE